MTAATPRQQVIVRRYKDHQSHVTADFQRDAVRLAAQGYHPTGQTWAHGRA